MAIAEIGGQSYHIDNNMIKNLDYIKQRVLHHNNMCVVIVDGRVGAGKSTIAAQLAYYCSDGKFTLKHETFTPDQFAKVLRDADVGDAIVLDEAFEVLNRRKSLTTANMLILSLLQQMRAKRVFIFIVLPSVYDLDKNLLLNLADVFVHTYRQDFGKRGQYACYSRQGLKKLWLYCRQGYSYNDRASRPNFRARFTKKFPLDEKAYQRKKITALKSLAEENKQSEGIKYRSQRNKLIMALKAKGMPVKEICGVVGLKSRTVYDVLEGNEKT